MDESEGAARRKKSQNSVQRTRVKMRCGKRLGGSGVMERCFHVKRSTICVRIRRDYIISSVYVSLNENLYNMDVSGSANVSFINKQSPNVNMALV